MPISYNDITYIANGDAITADVLNSPSTGLATRTLEVKRDSDNRHFYTRYTSDCVVAVLSDNPEEATVTVSSELRADGSTSQTLVRYYLPTLNNASFSIYSKSDHGARYIIPGSSISDLYNDAIDGTTAIRANALTCAGDGIYAKIPLRHTGVLGELDNFPDLAYPKTRAQSLTDQYQVSASAYLPEVVKLPELTRMDLADALQSTTNPLVVSSFTDLVEQQFSAHINQLTVDANTGALSITDSNSDTLDLKISGTQEGAVCHVSHVFNRESGSGIVLEFVRTTAPIYVEDLSRKAISGLTVQLYRGSTLLATSQVPLAIFDSGYFIKPKGIDTNYSYIPLVRLTETSLLIAGREYSLVKTVTNSGEVLNVHDAPVNPIDATQTAGTESYTVPLYRPVTNSSRYKGTYSITQNDVTADSGLCLSTQTEANNGTLGKLARNLVASDKVFLKSASALVTEEFTSSDASTVYKMRCYIVIDGVTVYLTNGDVAVTSLAIGDSFDIVPNSSTYIDITATVTSFDLIVQLFDSNDNLLTGAFSSQVDLLIV